MTTRTDRKKKLPLRKRILFSFVVLAIFIILGELIAPVFIKKQYKLQLGMMNAELIEDRELFWRLKPEFFNESNSISINRQGYRDTEFEHTRDPGTVRIACMGDSVTYGWKVPQGFTYPDILEEKLNFSRPSDDTQYEVYNFGVPGYSSLQGKILLSKEVVSYNPDILIISYGINDSRLALESDSISYIRNSSSLYNVKAFFMKSNLYHLLQQIWADWVDQRERRELSRNQIRVTPEEFKSNIETMVSIAKSHSMKVILLSQANTSRNDRLQPYFDIEKQIAESTPDVTYADAIDMLVSFSADEFDAYLRDLSKRFPVSALDGQKFFDMELTTPDAERFAALMVDPVHPNAAGCAMLGMQLEKLLIQNGLVN
ncbi:hypothetical protein JW979_15730 [bacterium]|nr:hypothetical protein [candidate division CSSED10-310 bacterium]